MADVSFKQRVADRLEPAFLLASASGSFITVLFEAVFLRGELLAPILRLQKLKDEAFSRFWIRFSVIRDEDCGTGAVEPTGSSALIPPLLARADGLVLDIGPGTGTQTPLFTNPNLTKMYGAEPCVGLHDELRAKIDSCGLSSKYQVLHCGAQPQSLVPALKDAGVLNDNDQRGIFDTVVCVRVLCSVPNPEETIKGLYDLIKPGGKLLVCEHVINPWTTPKGSVLGRLVQVIYSTLGWSFFLGDCHMNRDTERTLKRVAEADGGWESFDMEGAFGWGPLPYVSGVLVKKH
ncbi:hypothetical protein FQN57_006585 [Myotisia sp. PD_48]|nr:hypothetical protein FQN57_006585 [Myotisia sp. PD_48]